jgi:pyruvate/2-oxoacid:ferredoxin oxidoreductase alpha subunit
VETKIESKDRLKVLTGNAAAAYAVMLCRPDVVSGYPITPQTELWEVLYHLIADGLLDCETVEPEGEHSAMSIVASASAAGARTFTASAAQGLFFMFEPYIAAANQRLPIVMVNANRESLPPESVSGSGQDVMMVKTTGWIQIHVESCQEILDTIIMGYRLAEDPEILLPITVSYDGYYLSYFAEAVNIPERDKVDRFLPPRQATLRIDPESPMTCGTYVSSQMFTEYRVKHMSALQRANARLEEIEREFEKIFGRSYGGQLEEYRCQDAEIVLVAMNSCVGTAKEVVDQKRDEGLKVGLVKVRMFRPFPKERLLVSLRGKKAIGVIDRNVCFGWNCGHLLVELKASLMNGLEGPVPLLNFIGGLSGGDITLEYMGEAIDATFLAGQGKPYKEVTFFELQ